MTKLERLEKRFQVLYHKPPKGNEFSQFKKNYFGFIPMCIPVKYGTAFRYNSYQEYALKMREIANEEIMQNDIV